MTTVREPRLEPVAILDLPLACVILCIEQIGFVFIIAQSWFSIDLIFQCDFVSFCKMTTYTCIIMLCNHIESCRSSGRRATVRINGINARAPQKFDQTQGQAKVRALSLLHLGARKGFRLRQFGRAMQTMHSEGRRAMGREGGCSAAFYG